MFYEYRVGPVMNANWPGRSAWPPGSSGFVLNLLCWCLILALAPRLDQPPFPELAAPAERQDGMEFEMAQCWDCPLYTAFGRGFGSTWDFFPIKMFLLANWPALRAAQGPEGPMGSTEENPLIVLLVSSLQWFLLGAAWRRWRAWRTARRSHAVVEA